MRLLFFSFISFLISACDQACDVRVTNVAKFDNRTGSALSLSVCVRGLAKKKEIVTLDVHQNSQLPVAKYTSKRIKTGGPANACDPKEEEAGVYLTAESFTKAKFCHNTEDTSDIVVVDTGLTCPGGFTEQTAPSESCN